MGPNIKFGDDATCSGTEIGGGNTVLRGNVVRGCAEVDTAWWSARTLGCGQYGRAPSRALRGVPETGDR